MRITQYKKYLYVLLLAIACLFAVAIAMSGASMDDDVYAQSDEKTEASTEHILSNVETSYMNGSPLKSDEHYVCPCGYPIGIYVKTDGVMVINTGSFKCIDGTVQAPCEGILQQGDYIISINGMKLEDKNDLINIVSNCQGSKLETYIIRDGEKMKVTLYPKQNENGKYMLGLWIKDDISGIGTLTYIDENGFAALGHSINDNDTGEMFVISDGAIYETQLIRIVKSDGEHAGRIEGLIDYQKSFLLGRISRNDATGIKGTLTKLGKERFSSACWMPVADADDIHPGYAQILSWISGEPCYYDIEITNINDGDNSDHSGKDLEIKITDPKLLDMTSGIVQGLSGTPIVQDGKLAGAVTHVFIKDSTMGYGILAENMVK